MFVIFTTDQNFLLLRHSSDQFIPLPHVITMHESLEHHEEDLHAGHEIRVGLG
jgi:hypothetical protein